MAGNSIAGSIPGGEATGGTSMGGEGVSFGTTVAFLRGAAGARFRFLGAGASEGADPLSSVEVGVGDGRAVGGGEAGSVT
ncbi:MAG: ArsA family ATPase, partial [Thermoplasmata archaeon]|nr:ArsA family ATPase [Thermoplasmata archaeon]